VLRGLEEASGERIYTCPWQALRSPFVGLVIRSYQWWKEHQLETRWGGAVPEAIARGVEVYDIALRAVQAHDFRVEQERLDAERQRTDSGPPRRHPPRRHPRAR
jgi:hypothetical protein